jgi:hypothetical protein
MNGYRLRRAFTSRISISRCKTAVLIGLAVNFAVLSFTGPASVAYANQERTASNTWYVTIVLPPRVAAGSPATLAVLGADGRLASNVNVDISGSPSVKTDNTGRAFFTAAKDADAMFATASGASAVALVEKNPTVAAGNSSAALTVAPVISLKDRFSICGGGFRGDADANRVTMNGDRALVVAASPECLVVLPSPRATPGQAKLIVDSASGQRNVTTTLVSLQFEEPRPAPVPGERSQLTLHVEGSDSPLAITITNETPGVLSFLHGDTQELRTSGGTRNIAQVEISALRSGDFSFSAKLVPPPDITAAERYLKAAVPLAPKDLQKRVKSAADRLASHPNDREKVRQDVTKMISTTIDGNFRTLLEAARSAL